MIHHPTAMVDPLGRHWTQPPRQEVLIDDKHAVMSRKSFSMLLNYSHSTPSWVYDGKMWKSCKDGIWYLRWYAPSPNPTRCLIHTLPILLLEDESEAGK